MSSLSGLYALNLKLRDERGVLCEWCQTYPWTDKHHAIIPRDKRFPELDNPINFMVVCHHCHMTGEVDTWEARVLFYFLQKAKGYKVDEWLASLPIKTKPDFSRYTCSSTAQSRLLAEPLSYLVREQIYV